MRKNKRRKPMAEINVVPYIDVTLVLLIIFMITTPMLQTGVEVELPKAQAKVADQKENAMQIVIEVKENGDYRIKINDKDYEPMERDQITDKVSTAINGAKGPQIFIGADRGVRYEAVIQVFAELKNAGIANVGLMTEPEDNQ